MNAVRAQSPRRNRGWRRALLSLALAAAALDAAAGEVRITWRESAVAPEPRAGYAAGVIDGRLILAGGNYWLGEPGRWEKKVFVAVTDSFDPKTETWERLPDAPEAVSYAASVMVGDRLLLMGGAIAGAASDRVLWLGKSAEGFRWEEGSPLPASRVFAEAGVVGGVVYLAGGMREFELLDPAGACCLSQTAVPEVWALDLSRRQPAWEPRRPFPGRPRWGHRIVEAGGFLYQFGGKFQASLGDPVTWYHEVWRYDAAADEWSQVAGLPAELQGARGVELDGRILLVGRRGQAAVFDPATFEFTPATPLPEDVIVEYFMRDGQMIVGASGESGTERPRRRSELTYVGRIAVE